MGRVEKRGGVGLMVREKEGKGKEMTLADGGI